MYVCILLNDLYRNFGLPNPIKNILDRGGGELVNIIAFYSVDLSLNPAEVYSFYSVNLLENNKYKRK